MKETLISMVALLFCMSCKEEIVTEPNPQLHLQDGGVLYINSIGYAFIKPMKFTK